MALLIRAELVRAGPAGRRQPRAVQPALHDARHDHAAALRDAALRRLRQRRHAAADRGARRRVPAPQHVRLLALPLRRPHRLRRLPRRRRARPRFGWFAYAPLSDVSYSPGVGGDLWVFGLALAGFGTILGAVNFITTIICLRAPGMTMFRMPIFTWTVLVTSLLVIMVVPDPRRGALRARWRPAVRHAHLRPGERRGDALAAPVLVLRPPGGLHHRAAVLRHHQRGPPGLLAASRSSATRPWSSRPSRSRRCRRASGRTTCTSTGQVLLPFFSVMTMLIAVPTGREVLQLDRHDVGRQGVAWTRPCSGRWASSSPSSSAA